MSRINSEDFAVLLSQVSRLRTAQLETLERVVEKELASRLVSKTEKPGAPGGGGA